MTADDDSLAMAQASVASTVNVNDVSPLATTTAQGSSQVKPMDIDDNDLASMEDTIYDDSESSYESLLDSDSKTSLEDPPEEDSEENYHDSEPTAPPDDMVITP